MEIAVPEEKNIWYLPGKTGLIKEKREKVEGNNSVRQQLDGVIEFACAFIFPTIVFAELVCLHVALHWRTFFAAFAVAVPEHTVLVGAVWTARLRIRGEPGDRK